MTYLVDNPRTRSVFGVVKPLEPDFSRHLSTFVGSTGNLWNVNLRTSLSPASTSSALRRIAVTGMAAALASAVVSCSDSEQVETQAVELSKVSIKLLDAGDANKATVKWADEGAEQSSTIVVTQGFTQKSSNGTGDATTPDTRLEIPLTTTVTGSGDNRAVSAQVGTPHGSNADLNTDIATAEGFRSDWTAKANGELTELKYGAPNDATNTARAGVETALAHLHSIPFIFPAEPIGDGASWTAENSVGDDTEFSQKVTYTLKSRSGNTVELGLTVEQAPTTTELEGAEGGTLKVVDSSTETLQGAVSIDLTKPLPVSGVVDYVTSVIYGDGQSDVRIEQKRHRAIEFRS